LLTKAELLACLRTRCPPKNIIQCANLTRYPTRPPEGHIPLSGGRVATLEFFLSLGLVLLGSATGHHRVAPRVSPRLCDEVSKFYSCLLAMSLFQLPAITLPTHTLKFFRLHFLGRDCPPSWDSCLEHTPGICKPYRSCRRLSICWRRPAASEVATT